MSDLEKRIQRLEDIEALHTLMNDYGWIADKFDWEGWSRCFADDAEFVLPETFGQMTGRHEIRDTCKGNMDEFYEEMQHILVNVDFEITGEDTATGRGNLIFTPTPKKEDQLEYYQAGGRYEWEYRRTEDGWKISRASLVFLWNNGKDAAGVFDGEEAA